MVLWEITLGTAYFLGLKKTYKLALKAQRKLISPNHPKIRAFVYRRTRGVFDMAVTVHKKIQQTDIEAGRKLGNWMFRWVDNVKPAAEIRAKHSIGSNASTIGQIINSQKQKLSNNLGKFDFRTLKRDSNRNLFSASRNIWPGSFPIVAMMMRPMTPAGTFIQQRQFSSRTPQALTSSYGEFRNGVARADVIQWMQR